mgnify:CR=1 FL=1
MSGKKEVGSERCSVRDGRAVGRASANKLLRALVVPGGPGDERGIGANADRLIPAPKVLASFPIDEPGAVRQAKTLEIAVSKLSENRASPIGRDVLRRPGNNYPFAHIELGGFSKSCV